MSDLDFDQVREAARADGCFLAMLHRPDRRDFKAQVATFVAETDEHGVTAFCLSIGDEQWIIRPDDLLGAIGQALSERSEKAEAPS